MWRINNGMADYIDNAHHNLLLMIWPSDYIKDDKNKLRKYLYAHRGLHDDENDIPEIQ